MRPKKENRYDTQLNIVVTKEMHRLLTEEAEKRGISVAEYMRSRLFQMKGKRGPGPIPLSSSRGREGDNFFTN